MADETVLLGHGSGGTMMKRIIDDVFAATYGSEELAQGNDAALLPAPAPGERLAFSTGTFVGTPFEMLDFPLFIGPVNGIVVSMILYVIIYKAMKLPAFDGSIVLFTKKSAE